MCNRDRNSWWTLGAYSLEEEEDRSQCDLPIDLVSRDFRGSHLELASCSATTKSLSERIWCAAQTLARRLTAFVFYVYLLQCLTHNGLGVVQDSSYLLIWQRGLIEYKTGLIERIHRPNNDPCVNHFFQPLTPSDKFILYLSSLLSFSRASSSPPRRSVSHASLPVEDPLHGTSNSTVASPPVGFTIQRLRTLLETLCAL